MRATKERIEWTQQRTCKLLALKAEGKSTSYIAETFNTTPKAIRATLERIEMRKRRAERPAVHPSLKQSWHRNGERWSDEENAELNRRKARGESFAHIGYALNRTQWSCKIQYHSLRRGTAATPGVKTATAATVRQDANERIQQVRTEPLRYASPFSEMLGEPPIGRRAIDQKREGLPR